MNALDSLKELLAEERDVRLVEDDIYSVLSDQAHRHHYDKRAAVYDFVVGTRLYNSLMWGNTPRDYAAFAQEAINSSASGRFLDAGCGSLLFTAEAYLDCGRQIVAFDQSLAMLRRARRRLMAAAGGPLPVISWCCKRPQRLRSSPTLFRPPLPDVLHSTRMDSADSEPQEALVDDVLCLDVHRLNQSLVEPVSRRLVRTGEFVRP